MESLKNLCIGAIVRDDKLLILILKAIIMDLSNYFNARYLAKLVHSHEYHKNLLMYAERYDWHLHMELEMIYIEMGMGQISLIIVNDYLE